MTIITISIILTIIITICLLHHVHPLSPPLLNNTVMFNIKQLVLK